MIATVWVLAFAVSCPLLFGFNTTGQVTAFCFHLPVSKSSTHVLSHTTLTSYRIECEPLRCRVIVKFRVHMSSYCLGSTVGHEM